MTKNRSIKIAVLVLALALITSCFVGTTFAKYTSTGDGSSSARVALWKVTTGAAGTAVINGADSVTFDLFDTIKDTGGTAAETDVKVGDDENIIAPGTEGSFDLIIKNASEVTAAYGLSFTLTNTANVPLEFKVGNGAWQSTLTNVALNSDAEDDDNTILAMTNGCS